MNFPWPIKFQFEIDYIFGVKTRHFKQGKYQLENVNNNVQMDRGSVHYIIQSYEIMYIALT